MRRDTLKTSLLAVGVVLFLAWPLTQAQSTTVAVTGFGGARVQGSGHLVEERRTLAGFTGVRLVGPVNVELRAADRDGVTVRADDNIAPLIETRVSSGDRPTLEIALKDGVTIRTRHAPVVVVEFRALFELVMRGSGDARADRIAGEDFVLSMTGSGDVRIDALEVDRFAASLSGSGDLVVAGRADQQAIRIAGSGDVKARRLSSRGAQIAIAGSGDASVNASETLDVTIAGSGDVVYRGTPRITQRIRGSGAVRRAQ